MNIPISSEYHKEQIPINTDSVESQLDKTIESLQRQSLENITTDYEKAKATPISAPSLMEGTFNKQEEDLDSQPQEWVYNPLFEPKSNYIWEDQIETPEDEGYNMIPLEDESTWNSTEWGLLEEEERKRRMEFKVDPIMYGKLNQVHAELKAVQPTFFAKKLSGMTETIKEKAVAATETIKETVAEVSANILETSESMKETTIEAKEGLRDSASSALGRVWEATGSFVGKVQQAEESLAQSILFGFEAIEGKVQDVVHVAKDSLLGASDHVHASTWSEVTKAEEAERARRMNIKIDPLIEARKHKVEREILQAVHKC